MINVKLFFKLSNFGTLSTTDFVNAHSKSVRNEDKYIVKSQISYESDVDDLRTYFLAPIDDVNIHEIVTKYVISDDDSVPNLSACAS